MIHYIYNQNNFTYHTIFRLYHLHLLSLHAIHGFEDVICSKFKN